ncbi:glycoside hydrolase superfamily [Gorgonomyces haynaldii]|nr:glycoside hydrolase superfamily [Gorgonomyces haynaldii]
MRFGFATPNLHVQEDPWQPATQYEQEDILQSLYQMGIDVTRIYTLSIPKSKDDNTRHITVSNYGSLNAQLSLNPILFEGLDRLLLLCRRYNLKLIIPLIDYWEWWGGIESFSKIYGLQKQDFYTHPTIVSGFQSLVNQVLNRSNNQTGVQYKDDPFIFGWETGNELSLNGKPPPGNWTTSIANLIKSQSKGQWVIDGTYGKYGFAPEVLQSANIDAVSNHYYVELLTSSFSTLDFVGMGLLALVFVFFCVFEIANCFRPFNLKRKRWIFVIGLQVMSLIGLCLLVTSPLYAPSFVNRLQFDLKQIGSKKLIVGEVGLAPIGTITQLFQAIQPNDQIACTFVWSLRGHSSRGGFYTHQESNGYYSYHYPGFPAQDGFGQDERQMIALVSSYNQKRTLDLPPPFLFQPQVTDKINFKWRGVAGVSEYKIYGSPDNTTFKLLGNTSDSKPDNQVLFSVPKSTDRYFYVEATKRSNTVVI